MTSTDTTIDLRALAERPRQVVGLGTTDRGFAVGPAFSTDPATRAAGDHAEEAARRLGVVEAAKVADAIARIFPGAHRVVFELRENDNGDPVCDLWTVRDANNVLLWYDVEFADTPDAAAQAYDEAHGGPVLPQLDSSTHLAIEAQLEAACEASTGWTTWAGAAGEGLSDVGDTYSGELEALIVPEVLAEAKRLTSDGPAVTFDRKAFRAWCKTPDGREALGYPYDSSTDEASEVAERALAYMSDRPEVWSYGNGVTEVNIYRTTDSDGADGGGAVVFTIDGIELSAGHVQAGDLVVRKADDEGRVIASGASAAAQALAAIADAVNVAAARYRLTAGRRETPAAGETDPTLVLWLTGELTRTARTGEQPVHTAERIAAFLTSAGLLVMPAPDNDEDTPQLRDGEVWRPVTLGFDGQGGDVWHAVYDPYERWNGWLCPRFRRDEAELMRLYFEAGAARNPEMTEMDTLRWDNDVLVLVSGQYNRDGGMLEQGQEPDEDRIEPDERGLYAIGGYSWCWSAAGEPATAGDAPASGDTYEDFAAWRDAHEGEPPTIRDAARQFTGTPLGTLVQWWVRERPAAGA